MSEKVIVTVKEGKVRGFKTKTTYSGVDYYTFLGIPYGQTTAGTARFKDPVKVKPWNTTLDATVPKEGCRQFSMVTNDLAGTEDCLFNNIYTPEIPKSTEDSLKAVIVSIHPGGHNFGSPNPSEYGAPDYIMHLDVVYVCVAFRLHVYGFLNLHLKSCSGNQCLKDIILSLQWIKENISSFGGDPNNITVMGSSSGSEMVHSLLLSPLAKGLYHKAILMGKYIFNPVTVRSRENATVAYEIVKKMGYDGQPQEYTKLLNFYKNIQDFKECEYLVALVGYSDETKLQIFPSIPFVYTPEPGENSPLPISPRELIPTTNRVPIIIGFCEREACLAFTNYFQFSTKNLADNFYKAIQQNEFGWAVELKEDQLKLLQKEVEKFYLDGEPLATASQSILCDILTDAALSDVYDSLINVISADLPSSVFVYNFRYDGKLCLIRNWIGKYFKEELPGALHATDFSYWNHMEKYVGKNTDRIHPKDRQIIDKFTNLLTTFAKTSNPNYEGLEVEWKPTTPENPSHLIIEENLHVKDELLNGKRMEFWHELKNKFISCKPHSM